MLHLVLAWHRVCAPVPGHGYGGVCAHEGVLCIVILYLVDWRFGNPIVDFVFYAVGLLAFIGTRLLLCVCLYLWRCQKRDLREGAGVI